VRSAKRTPPESGRDGVITSLVAKSGRSDRVAVYLDGCRAFDVAAGVADKAGLRAGEVLTVDQQRRLAEEDAPFRARERALGLLSLRDRSRREIETRLKTAGFEPEVISDTVGWLEGLGYVDDARFAAHFTGEKLKSGWGPQRIRVELLRKGVERRVVDEELSSEAHSDRLADEGLENVTALARRRFGRQFMEDPVAAERRLAGFLARRGYDWDAIHTVARALSPETAEAAGAGSCFPDCGVRPGEDSSP
jgi:regulatory protein